MSEIMTSSTAKFDSFKREMKSKKLFSTDVELTDIKIVSEEFIEIGGTTLAIEKSAFQDLVRVLGLSKKILRNFQEYMSEKAKLALLRAMQNGLANAGKRTVFLYATKERVIVRILSDRKPGLTDGSYTDLVERVMNENPNFEINSFAVDETGMHLNLLNTKQVIDLPNMQDESFHFGLSIDNDFKIGTAVSPFNERLICTNGMVTRSPERAHGSLVMGRPGTFNLKELTSESWNDFFEHMTNLANNHFIAPGFVKNVQAAKETPASVAEVLNAKQMMQRHSGVGNDAELWIPTDNMKSKYMAHGVDLDTVEKDTLVTAQSNQTVWDVINGVTDFASHKTNFEISDKQRNTLKVFAGDFLLKGTYDMNKIMQVNPFAMN